MLTKNKIVIAIIICLSLASTCFAWGPSGHTAITRHAIELLPAEMKPFFEANSSYIVALTMLPDDWRASKWDELAPNHYIDLDAIGKPPFTDLIMDKAAAESKFGKSVIAKAGILPWTINDRYGNLVKAMKNNDQTRIVVESALLAHFVGDAHVPMHATKNYDGDRAEEKGIHHRWESTLFDTSFKQEGISPVMPSRIDDVLKSSFEWCTQSFKYNDTIFRADDKARQADPLFGPNYYKTMYELTGHVMAERLTSASEDLAGLWVKAWQDAGKPKLSDKPSLLLFDYWNTPKN